MSTSGCKRPRANEHCAGARSSHFWRNVYMADAGNEIGLTLRLAVEDVVTFAGLGTYAARNSRTNRGSASSAIVPRVRPRSQERWWTGTDGDPVGPNRRKPFRAESVTHVSGI